MNARSIFIRVRELLPCISVLRRSRVLTTGILTVAASVCLLTAKGNAQVTGASVNESPIGTYYYVDAANGNDAHAGTYSAPFATINKAISKTAAVIKSGVKIFVNPGIYRETITLGSSNTSIAAPLIVEATQPGAAIISGADRWSSGWVAHGKTWVHSWPYSWGYAASPWTGVGSLGLRREVVSINGKLLTQTLSTSLTTPATFAVTDGSQITVYPPAGTNMSTADIEVGVRSGLFSAPYGVSNLVLRGLTFEYDTTPINGNGKGAVTTNSANNLLIENCKILYNNWVGISLMMSNNVTFSNIDADANGEDGIKGYHVTNWLLNNSETTWNNWRSASGNLYGVDVAGMKVMDVHGLALQNFTSRNNLAYGLWFDTDIANAAVSFSNLSFNLKSGLLIENCEGPVRLSNTLVSYNKSLGIIGNAAQNIAISSSTLYGNAVTQIQITGADAAVSVKDFQTGQYYSVQSSEWTFANDVVAAATSNTSLFSSGLKNSWSNFIATLSSDFNDWYQPATSVPMFYLGASHSLADWRSATGQDASSSNAYVTAPPAQ
jgi:parallel beta-helix repeat protein